MLDLDPKGLTLPYPKALVGAAMALGALSFAGSAEAAERCSSLRGANLLKGNQPAVKVVDRRSGSRHRYLACAIRSGQTRPRVLTTTRRGGRLSFLDHEGGVVAVRDVSSKAVTVWNLGAGTRRRLRDGNRNPVGRVVVADSGESAASFGSSGAATLIGFDHQGRRSVLDRNVVASSLRRSGLAISWRSNYRRGAARLSELPTPCSALTGRVVRRTAELLITSFTFRSEFLRGELNGRTTRLRACVLPGGQARVLGENTTGPGAGSSTLEIRALAGTFVLLFSASSSSGAEVEPEQYWVYDVAADKVALIWGNQDQGGPNTSLGSPDRLLLTAAGQVGGLFTTSSGAVQVVGFNAAGRATALDTGTAAEIPAASLTLDNTVLRWTRGGQPRSADLAAL